MKFSIFQESRIGKRRINQDRMHHASTRDALLMVVADGMGGHQHGEVAAQIAVDTITSTFNRLARTTLTNPFLFLSQSISQAHLAINRHSGDVEAKDVPRTTCVVCLIQGGAAYWAHVGDSRLYVLRAGRALVQTRDHSHVRRMVEQGLIDETQAGTHPARNLVYSCLGGDNPPEIEFSRKLPLQHHDLIALCSDGAWSPLHEALFVSTLSGQPPAEAVPQVLDLAEANAGARCDNLTLMALRWEDESEG
ncbi:MAG: serine/threonine-protein phosphatase [Sterolibacterium sp.]|jgi:serine/threonine protein phosphatase PrpC|nr:serine/threonine-protein phosphatase [Sterolibacterium sp.]MBP9799911.1 serine/threonine-protein phosphatase [Sterolibacterium sp.]